MCLRANAGEAEAIAAVPSPTRAETVVIPQSVPDPLEPLNRVVWSVNRGVMTGVIKPTSSVYRWVVPAGVRRGVGNFGKNLTYPGRLINNLLQGKWRGARDESYRFVCNTTVGVGGLFAVADRWKLPKSEADFGQTFGQWGWEPVCYLMLPIFGPSNERDTVGLAADSAANPLLYISPYALVADNPLTYLGPYTYFTYAVMYNDLSDTVREYVRFSRAEADPYAQLQYAWTFARKNRVADFQVTGEQDQASLETIESVFFTFENPDFPGHGRTRSVLIPATGRRLDFTYWLQPREAPVVYIVPGMGSHRLAKPCLALAELAFKHGFSAVCVSSTFHPEFMEHASTAPLPAYLPADAQDLGVALTQVDQRLRALHPGRLGEKALLGYSMGAMDALYLAANEPEPTAGVMRFDRYLAVNTPVRFLHGVEKLDEYYRAPLEWPVAERQANLENTLLKVAVLSKTTIAPQASLPFNAIESKFLIGLSFRFTLRDIIYSSQRRHNQGVLRHELWHFRRGPVYQEILQSSYRDYLEKFVVPAYEARGLPAATAEGMESAGDLRSYTAGLGANPRVRIIVNQNDFLLAESDLSWLHTTFAARQLTVFPEGGHLGNLGNPAVQKSILGALEGLR